MSRNVKIESVQIIQPIIQPKFKVWEHENYKLLKWLQIVSMLAGIPIWLLYYTDKINGVSAFAAALVISIIPILVERLLKISQGNEEAKNKEGYTFDAWAKCCRENRFNNLKVVIDSDFGLISYIEFLSPHTSTLVLEVAISASDDLNIDVEFVEGLKASMVRDLLASAVESLRANSELELTAEEELELVVFVLTLIENPTASKDLKVISVENQATRESL